MDDNPPRDFLIVLYGSMLTTSLISALLGMCGKKAKFIVTPKTATKITFWQAVKFQKNEILFSSLFLTIGLIMHNVLSVILIISTGYLSLFLLFLSNRTYNETQIQKIDAQSSKISLSTNKTYVYTENLEEQLKKSA